MFSILRSDVEVFPVADWPELSGHGFSPVGVLEVRVVDGYFDRALESVGCDCAKLTVNESCVAFCPATLVVERFLFCGDAKKNRVEDPTQKPAEG